MISGKPGKKLNLYVSDYVLFDLETTGFYCDTDEIVEISAIKVKNGEVVDEFSALVNPLKPIPYRVSQVHGITDDMVKDCPDFETVFPQFLEFVGDLTLVGHNIYSFDMKFLYRYANQYYGKTIGNDYVDTYLLAKTYLPQLEHKKLTDLAQYYGISSAGAHRALNDCRMNQKVFEMLGKEIENPSEAAKAIKKCPRCNNMLKLRNGRFGEFWGCTGYPDCRFTQNVAQ